MKKKYSNILLHMETFLLQLCNIRCQHDLSTHNLRMLYNNNAQELNSIYCCFFFNIDLMYLYECLRQISTNHDCHCFYSNLLVTEINKIQM